MNSIFSQMRNGALFTRIFAMIACLVPAWALAAGAEASVKLDFTKNNGYWYIGVSIFLALVAIATGLAIFYSLMGVSPGNEKMQEVSNAIRQGALAYLRQQFNTMIWFVIAIAIALFAYYQVQFPGIKIGPVPISACLPITFVLGVGASYLAGYVGMLMAIGANCRVANAALTSYKSALEIAFRSGAVAGMVTVGLGLLGAALIFLIAGAEAMKLLIGFGFGGSLAALFMRVGGGIFTKAADVGADLVGKVEAGIPEDDARNPATIADNVGDNVGDCAGMAADIFESYEVTLVAAIVLGAATAAIFDSQTWMKLILFALMARGVGIVASIIGIFLVKGSDSADVDPLEPIRTGFRWSALIAAAGTFALAAFMMSDVNTTTFRLTNDYRNDELRAVQAAISEEAKQESKETYEIATKDIVELAAIKAIFKPAIDAGSMQETDVAALVDSYRMQDEEKIPKSPELKGFTELDPNAAAGILDSYCANDAGDGAVAGRYVSLRDSLKKQKLVVMNLEILEAPVAPVPGQPAPPSPKPRKLWIGPVGEEEIKKQIESARTTSKMKIDVLNTFPAKVYSNSEGKIILAYEATNDVKPHLIQPGVSLSYYKLNAKKMNELATPEAGSIAGPKPTPPAQQVEVAVIEHKNVPWWLFAIAICVGIIMAFLIEMLTDYFVSLTKKPVKEVAAASTAGPAPMIIQGFAYAMESSVWSVFAIVLALLAPVFIFPPAEYGGFILSFYGVALVGLGLLTTTGYILAMDTFGPISDNAQGVYEMSGAGHDEEKIEGKMAGSRAVQLLDAAGNTTKALTKGFAIATAVVAAVALFHSFIEDAHLAEAGLRLEVPQIFIGLLIGGAAPFLFSAFAINAVGRSAFELIGEVRAQFKADPGIMAGTSKPNYGRCVAIVTAAAQKELLGPGILAIALPVLVGFGLAIGQKTVLIGGTEFNLVGAQALGGFLAGAILSGQLLAVTLANSGGIWDNAKKSIEDGNFGGKGSESHKAGVVCDTVGDPFKDTAGPALNPLIKVMNLVALLLAPAVIVPMSPAISWSVVAVCLVLLGIAVYWSKRGSIGSELAKSAAASAE